MTTTTLSTLDEAELELSDALTRILAHFEDFHGVPTDADQAQWLLALTVEKAEEIIFDWREHTRYLRHLGFAD